MGASTLTKTTSFASRYLHLKSKEVFWEKHLPSREPNISLLKVAGNMIILFHSWVAASSWEGSSSSLASNITYPQLSTGMEERKYPSDASHSGKRNADFWRFQVFAASKTENLHELVGGGNSNILYFHPENWGRFPIWRAYFSDGLVRRPTRFHLLVLSSHPFDYDSKTRHFGTRSVICLVSNRWYKF